LQDAATPTVVMPGLDPGIHEPSRPENSYDLFFGNAS
jgi:hypothetical protein